MPNTREKLIELLLHGRECPDGRNPFLEESCNTCPYGHAVDCGAEMLADHLIANGVTVSLVPVGSTVYALYNRNMSYRGVFSRKPSKRNSQIITNGCLNGAKYGGGNIEIREKKCTKADLNLLGRLVFTSREDAERVLKEGANNG